ncbi:MAG: type II secretion system minor pseudopilin GspI [Proteobacteria bacterium]|nr:type II secretion system minor pseudopilin GspI [Pseudomonadota bacterium]MBU1737032.1 type II secretion system minor pseudopilin GspI [Pseudomonadota bacterium]
MSRHDFGQRGFTLLEILVALAVFSIVALTALTNNNVIIDNSRYIEDKTLAHWVAMNKAAELQLAGNWVKKEGEKGVAVMAGRSWNWQAVGQNTPDPDIQLVEIKVVSADESGNQAVRTDLTLYLGRPAGYQLQGTQGS